MTMGQYESVYLGEMEMAEAKRNMAGKRPNIVEGPVAPDTAKTVAFRGLTAFSGLVLTLGPIYFSFRAFLIFRASSSATWMQISVYCLFLFVEVAFSSTYSKFEGVMDAD